MKIEKLTDNKIRIIMQEQDLSEKNIDIHTFMSKDIINSDGLILDVLNKAERELDFNTEGCKLLIEAFSAIDDVLVLTITKSTYEKSKKTVTVKRKTINSKKNNAMFKFENFDVFCAFCKSLSEIHDFEINKFSKNISLYLYNNIYYLTIKNINIKYQLLTRFYSYISEFSNHIEYSTSFENKLLERGNIIMKQNALQTGIKYFA